jgi:hypothetical protein
MQRLTGLTCISILLALPLTGTVAGDAPEEAGTEEAEEEIIAEEDDDTLEIDTEATVNYTEAVTGFKFDGDFRAIYDYFDVTFSDATTLDEDIAGFRARSRVDYGITEPLHVGARIAGTCFTDDNCNLDFVMEDSAPQRNGLKPGQFTFDELYLHWFRPRGSLAVGRLQTRFVLRSGVYAKSLDRNNSNNVNVNWTDGAQVTYRAKNSWNSSFVWERNSHDGASSIRHGPLDFDDSKAQNTWFVGFENIDRWGPIVQRSLDISYLPSSLLKDGTADGRREDYWGIVGRLVGRWPQRREGIRLRAGLEAGYAPNTASREAANLDTDISGLAWNAVISLMDFLPTHSIGINYARTGAGWLISPQFRPNEELFEVRYIWNPDKPYWPLLEVRLRWQEEIEQRVDRSQKAEEFDGYIRFTWDVTFKGRLGLGQR